MRFSWPDSSRRALGSLPRRTSGPERKQLHRPDQLQNPSCLSTDAAQRRKLSAVTDRLSLPDQERHGAGREKTNLTQVNRSHRLHDRPMISLVGRDRLRVDLADQAEHGNTCTGLDGDTARGRQ